jgi:SsrA-binding protein
MAPKKGADKDKGKGAGKLVAENRRARYDYFIMEDIEAGIMLTGTEVKSLREGRATITDAHAGEMAGELYIFNINIPEYKAGNRYNHEPKRPRKLLVHAKQKDKLLGQVKMKGLALVPLKMYFNARGLVKLLLGIGKGKKEYEKRDTIKKRDWEKQQRELLKKNR